MKKGFTLIEILMVVTILSVLAVSVFVALNPVKRLKDAKDARRSSDADTLLTAIHQYIVDNKGALPTGLSTSMAITMISGTTGTACNVTPGTYCGSVPANCVDLSTPLATYLKSIPIDPNGATGTPAYTLAKTGYAVTVDANNIITITSCASENSAITISR
jgi:prepilin-type N-terminal cleavage/methylation domain-containing protein